MEELLPFLFFVAYIIISIIGSGNKRKKRKRKAQPPVVAQQPKPRPQPKAQPQPVNKKRAQKPVNQPVRQPKRVQKKIQQPVQSRKPAKKSVSPKPRKNPFEITIDEMLRELEVKDPPIRKPKPKPQLFDKAVQKSAPKKKAVVKVQKTASKVRKPNRRKKINLKKKITDFDFNALDAIIYSEIINKKY